MADTGAELNIHLVGSDGQTFLFVIVVTTPGTCNKLWGLIGISPLQSSRADPVIPEPRYDSDQTATPAKSACGCPGGRSRCRGSSPQRGTAAAVREVERTQVNTELLHNNQNTYNISTVREELIWSIRGRLFTLPSPDLFELSKSLAQENKDTVQFSQGDKDSCMDYVTSYLQSTALLQLEDESMSQLLMLDDLINQIFQVAALSNHLTEAKHLPTCQASVPHVARASTT
ncbi:uncharacterized protein LOC122864761 [Siniperca chuatsi]|uniref:uncharacterized protein LOC122864761 n=1 Tax=Siniperca chuatsi TaxID=119488 RepID=UPI001CE10F05|nr:uncharacterized protein LOC122864761 [Siniperca chuatsi]